MISYELDGNHQKLGYDLAPWHDGKISRWAHVSESSRDKNQQRDTRTPPKALQYHGQNQVATKVLCSAMKAQRAHHHFPPALSASSCFPHRCVLEISHKGVVHSWSIAPLGVEGFPRMEPSTVHVRRQLLCALLWVILSGTSKTIHPSIHSNSKWRFFSIRFELHSEIFSFIHSFFFLSVK